MITSLCCLLDQDPHTPPESGQIPSLRCSYLVVVVMLLLLLILLLLPTEGPFLLALKPLML